MKCLVHFHFIRLIHNMHFGGDVNQLCLKATLEKNLLLDILKKITILNFHLKVSVVKFIIFLINPIKLTKPILFNSNLILNHV